MADRLTPSFPEPGRWSWAQHERALAEAAVLPIARRRGLFAASGWLTGVVFAVLGLLAVHPELAPWAAGLGLLGFAVTYLRVLHQTIGDERDAVARETAERHWMDRGGRD